MDTNKHLGFTIKIKQDCCSANPRTEWDNLAHLWCWHKRYDLGDEKPSWAEHWFDTADTGDSIYDEIEEEFRPVVIEPLSLLDHSGLTLYKGHGAHQCDPGGWDSGPIGLAFISRKDALKEHNCKYITKRIRGFCQKVLDAEIETYDMALRGDVWGYIITASDGKEVDSCWGFYGYDYCLEEAKSMVDTLAPAHQVEIIEEMRKSGPVIIP